MSVNPEATVISCHGINYSVMVKPPKKCAKPVEKQILFDIK